MAENMDRELGWDDYIEKESDFILLKEGDYTEKAKMQNELKGPIMGAYWCILVAIYLFWSFTADSWKISWIVFVAGGILSSLVEGLCIFISNKRQG